MKGFLMILAVAVVFMGFSGVAVAAGGGGFTSSGTKAEPYIMDSKEQLEMLALRVAEGNNMYGKYFKMTNDIDLGCSAENQWATIGLKDNQFNGHFDGGGFEVSGLYISNSLDGQGFFGYIGKGGSVSNFGVSGYVDGGDRVGGVVGHSYGNITNCYNTGKVNGWEDRVGGVVGSMGYSSSVTNCYNSGEVSGTGGYVGGVAGYSSGSVTNCYRLKGCVVQGTERRHGTKMTTKKMKSAEFVTLLNGSQDPKPWTQDTEPFENQGYPILNWQQE